MRKIILPLLILSLLSIFGIFGGEANSATPAKIIPVPVASKIPTSTPAVAPKLTVQNPAPFLGDAVIVSYSGKSAEIEAATFGGKPVSFFDYASGSRVLLPIAPTARTGAYTLSVKFKNGTTATRTVTVKAKKFPLIDLGVPDHIDQTPDQAVQGLAKTNASLSSIWKATSSAPQFRSAFAMPLKKFTRYGAPFGELRKTGSSHVRHLGTDFTAAIGTPVYSINNGVVSKAYNDSSYGNTVVIDHGAGIFSLYLHLNSMAVREGAEVTKGQKIGEVGETGYAFGPHLHFSVKVDGVSVDPVRFVQSFR